MNSSSQPVLQKGADAMSIITACWFKTDRGVNINWQQTQYSQRIPDCHEGWIDVLFSKNKGASLKTNIQNKTNQPTKKLTTKTNLLKYLNGMENMQKRVPRCLWLHSLHFTVSGRVPHGLVLLLFWAVINTSIQADTRHCWSLYYGFYL